MQKNKPSWFEDILDFCRKAEQAIGTTPNIPSKETIVLRKNLIKEEVVTETLKALEEGNLEKIADGIIDSIVVLIGTGISYGLDLEKLWDEIHKTNMAKLKDGVIKNNYGKIQKPEGWKPPNVKKILSEQKSLLESYPENVKATEENNMKDSKDDLDPDSLYELDQNTESTHDYREIFLSDLTTLIERYFREYDDTDALTIVACLELQKQALLNGLLEDANSDDDDDDENEDETE